MTNITSGYITHCGPWMPVLKEGESSYLLTPEQLSDLLNKAFHDGYQFAKGLYYLPETTVASSSTMSVAAETKHGTQ